MKDWKQACVSPEAAIRAAIETIDAAALQIALVVDEDRRLLGVVTDGDVRRGILNGCSLEEPVRRIMNPNPAVIGQGDEEEHVLEMMRQNRYHQVPVVDEERRVIGLKLLDELIQPTIRPNWVVFMAGGLGTRLHPLTHDCPKPLLKVGSKPILETILDNFVAYGFRKFYFTVNYMAEMIEKHFEDGTRWNVEIQYIREDDRMGTAGALSLLPEPPKETLLVMNGDLLTQINVDHLLQFHREHKAVGTMCVREYDFQVPYGVVSTEEHRIVGIEEKPVHRLFVNAGIYALEPEALDFIPERTFFDMPDLFTRLLTVGHDTVAFPIREYWMDIGHMEDYERAKGDFSREFI